MEVKEHLLHYLLGGHIHLSKKDYGFFNNLQYLIKDNQKITSNQVKLFDKLLIKYQRQIKKNNLDINYLNQLRWRVEIVETLAEYLEAKISIIDNTIQIRSPFNNKFIQYIRKIHPNPFLWNKITKMYEAEYSTYALKTAFSSVTKFYDNVRCCDTTNRLLSELEFYNQARYWNPTLVKSNDNFYIAAINETLYNALDTCNLNDDPSTLFHLSTYGIEIDNNIIDNDKFKSFASHYETIVDLEDIDLMAEWLKLLKVEQVYTARDIIYNRTVSNEVKNTLQKHNLSIKNYNSATNEGICVLLKNTTYAYMEIKNIYKVIHLTNSRTITVK